MVNPNWQQFNNLQTIGRPPNNPSQGPITQQLPNPGQVNSQDMGNAYNQEKKWSDFESPVSQKNEGSVPLTNPTSYKEEAKPETKQYKWGDFKSPSTYQGEIDPLADEDTFGYLLRNTVANSSRIFEQVAGSPGNAEKLGKDILSNFPGSGGLLGTAIHGLIGQDAFSRLIKGEEGKEQMLPTSENIKEISQKATSGYTKPKTKGEERFQNITEDVAATLLPGVKTGSGMKNAMIQHLGIPLASNTVKNVVEDLGFGKDKASMAKMLVWTGLSLANSVNAPKYASELMNEGRNGIPQDLQISVGRFNNRLDGIASNLLNGDPRTALARRQINAIQEDLKNGQTTVRSLMSQYDGVNAAKRDAGLFTMSRSDRDFARKSIDSIRDALREEIMSSGASHPEALESWANGVRAWSTIHKSKALTNWVSDLANGKYAKMLSGPAAGLFGVTSYGGVKAPLVGIPAAIGAPAAYKGGQILYRVFQDPNLAKYYWNALGAASAENAPAFMSNYNKLNKGLERSLPVEKANKRER